MNFRFDVPPELVRGENLVVFHLLDRGVESFFDARILGELAPAQVVQQLDDLIVLPQAPLVPISNVSVDSRVVVPGEQSSTTVSYVVAGTEEVGEIRIEQTAGDAFTVEFLLDGERMAFGTSTPEEMAVVRSLQARQRLADLDPGMLSVAAAFAEQSALEAIFQSIQTPVQLSCETTCDLTAALDTALASLTSGFLKGAGSGSDIERDRSIGHFRNRNDTLTRAPARCFLHQRQMR